MGRHFSRRDLLLGGAGGGLLLATGCDLIEFAKNPNITFDLPPRTYTLSTDDPNWQKPPSFLTAQAISCTSKEGCCPPPGVPAGAVSPADCAPVVCKTSVCGIEFPLEVFNKIDLSKDASALATSTSISEITLESLKYTITNGVGVDFPAVKLYIAPESTTTASGAGVQFIGETPVAPKGVVTMETRDTPAAARAAVAMYAKNFKTPFNFIAATTMSVLSGAMISSGKVDIVVTGTVNVKF